MKIKTAEFVISNSQVSSCPKDRIPEYAFVGRSNVGKSSLINMLVNRKALAKTSGTPGKTRLINHFRINNNWHLVDLPGYGYARASKTTKRKLQSIIKLYFEERRQLISTFVLIDVRHTPQNVDLNFLTWLGEKGLPFSIIFTKLDKLEATQISKKIEIYKTAMLGVGWEEMPPYFLSSSVKGMGRDDILSYIQNINEDITT